MNDAATDGHPLRCTQDGAMPIVLAEELEADPHTVCARYRTVSPVVARSTGGFVVLGAAEIDALLKDESPRHLKPVLLSCQSADPFATYTEILLSFLRGVAIMNIVENLWCFKLGNAFW